MLLVCANCYASLALDQRYCVECGVRARALPARGPWGTPPGLAHAAPAPAPEASGGWLWPVGGPASPRVAAVAVMSMLAFGAELGAAVGAGTPLGPTSTVVINRPAVAPAQVASAPAALATTQTQTITTGGGSPAPAASGSGPSTGAAAAPASTTTASSTPSATPVAPGTNAYGLPKISHVFVILLGNAGLSQTFSSRDAYLGTALPKQGKLLRFYYGVSGGELANELALFSGQGPTDQTVANCSTYSPFVGTGSGQHHQALGSGCVYPKQVSTLGGQLSAAHLTWRAYVQGQASGLPGQPQACVHPPLGQVDPHQSPGATNPYVTWRNPFVYFQSVTGTSQCAKQDADFSQLSTDLTTEPTTPNLSVIVPNPCDDARADPCRPGATSGPAAADSFLKSTISQIKASAAYQAGGLIIVTGDQAPQAGVNADPTACCATPVYPNLHGPAPAASAQTSTTSSSTSSSPDSSATAGTSTGTDTTATSSSSSAAGTTTTSTTSSGSSTTTAPSLGAGQTTPAGGGGQIGALLISPWVKQGTDDPLNYYNHYSLLKSLEEIFGIKQRLGYAGVSGLNAFTAATFDGTGPRAG